MAELRVAVTGAEGFVGGFMVARLLAAGHEVAAFVRTADSWTKRKPLDTGRNQTPQWVIPVDITQAAQVNAAVEQVRPQGVIHLAAQASPGASWHAPGETYRVNIVGTSLLFEALAEHRPRVLLVGSAQQYRRRTDGAALAEDEPLDASSPYALSKITQEQIGWMYHRHDGLEVMATRSFNHTGPGQDRAYAVGSFAYQIARIQRGEQEQLNVGNLTARRDFLDVRDVVGAYLALLESGAPGQAYNVCSGRDVLMGDVLDSMLKLAGLQGAITIHEHAPEDGAADVLVGDPKKIYDQTGWAPKTPLQRAITDTFTSYGGVRRGEDLALVQTEPSRSKRVKD